MTDGFVTHQFGIGLYHTRDGRIAEVTHVNTDPDEPYPLIGCVAHTEFGWEPERWSADGKLWIDHEHDCDLIAPIDEKPNEDFIPQFSVDAQTIQPNAIPRKANQPVVISSLWDPLPIPAEHEYADISTLLQASEANREKFIKSVSAKTNAIRTGWTDITAALPGHDQVVEVQDEDGNVAEARMDIEHGLCGSLRALKKVGTVKRWRVA